MHQRKWIQWLLIAILTVMISACGGGATTTTAVSGLAQKGPFVAGAIAKIYKLDDQYQRTTQMLETTISGTNGSYSFGDIGWSGLSEIEVSGYFLNENTGDTTQTAKVTTIVMVQANGSVTTNVNVLTHMASGYIRQLLQSGSTLAEANAQAYGEVMGILGRTDLGIGDFGDLDLADLIGDGASANSELLLLSAALLGSDNYMTDLEALLVIYREGGIDAVMASAIYDRLMLARQQIDVTIVTNHLLSSDDAPNAVPINVPPMILISRVLGQDSINLVLYGAKFASTTPHLTLNVQGGVVTAGAITVSDDNSSANIAISGDIGGCVDVNISIMIDYNELISSAINPITSNTINLHPAIVMCSDSGDGETSTPIMDENKPPVAIIGMDMMIEGTQQDPQSTTAAVGAIVSGLETYYSYDQEYYPIGAITHCQWSDESDHVVMSSNDNQCDIYDKVFDTAGVYVYTLTVTDNHGATNSNTITITITVNNIPEVTLSPSTDQEIIVGSTFIATATATDADSGDVLTYRWEYQRVGDSVIYSAGSSDRFSHLFDVVGEYIIKVIVGDSHGAETTAQIQLTVTNPDDADPIATIDGNASSQTQTIYAGNAPYAMGEGTDDHGISYCKWEDADGVILVEKEISPAQTPMYYDECMMNFEVLTEAGNYIYTFTVRDTIGQEDSNDLNVTVLPNSTPVVDIGIDRTIEVNNTLEITAEATDDDGDAMTYLWMYGLKSSGTRYGAGATEDFSHKFDTVGIHEVILEVRDIHNATVQVSIDVNVTEPVAVPDPVGTVSVGDLMWEDTDHVRSVVMTWSAANNYCDTLELGGFDNWRISHVDESNMSIAEVFTIRQLPKKNDGEEWDPINDSTDDINGSSRTIIEPFVLVIQDDTTAATWTDRALDTWGHVVAFFAYQKENADGMGNDENVSVRCVRDKI